VATSGHGRHGSTAHEARFFKGRGWQWGQNARPTREAHLVDGVPSHFPLREADVVHWRRTGRLPAAKVPLSRLETGRVNGQTVRCEAHADNVAGCRSFVVTATNILTVFYVTENGRTTKLRWDGLHLI